MSGDSIVVLPGDDVTQHVRGKAKLGSGLRRLKEAPDQETILATLAGKLVSTESVAFVRQSLRRYRPFVEDRVVGVVQGRAGMGEGGGDLYKVHIHASHLAILPSLSFEGASKRNRPHFSPGDLVYARVSEIDCDGSCTLSCVLGPHDVGVPRKDWMTNEGTYGELRGGTVTQISTGLARELLKPAAKVLNELAGKKWPFELAIGVNGLLWVHSSEPEYTVAIQNAIQNAEVLTEAQIKTMVRNVALAAENQMQQRTSAMELE